MQNKTIFKGELYLDKPLDDRTFNLLMGLSLTKRVKRDPAILEELDEGEMESFGTDGEFYIGQNYSAPESVVFQSRPPSTQPGHWLNWQPTEDRKRIRWVYTENFDRPYEWLEYIIHKILSPKGYKLNGNINGLIASDETNFHFSVINNKLSLLEPNRLSAPLPSGAELYSPEFRSKQVRKQAIVSETDTHSLLPLFIIEDEDHEQASRFTYQRTNGEIANIQMLSVNLFEDFFQSKKYVVRSHEANLIIGHSDKNGKHCLLEMLDNNKDPLNYFKVDHKTFVHLFLDGLEAGEENSFNEVSQIKSGEVKLKSFNTPFHTLKIDEKNDIRMKFADIVCELLENTIFPISEYEYEEGDYEFIIFTDKNTCIQQLLDYMKYHLQMNGIDPTNVSFDYGEGANILFISHV